MSLQDLNWYCFRVPSNREMQTVSILQRLNYNAFTPTEKKLRRRNYRSKSRIAVTTAIFPGYIFIGFYNEPNWRQLWLLERSSAKCGIPLVEKPPRYHVDEGRNVHCITGNGEPIILNQDRLLLGVVSAEGRPAVADGEQVLHAMTLSSAIVPGKRDEEILPFAPGDKAEIIDGAFDGFLTEVVDLTEDKARVLIEILGSKREIEIATGSLQAA